MANELQTKLDAILLDKNTNLLPENLKAGVNCLGVNGTYEGSGGGTTEGVKLFETQEEMQSDPTAKEGDLAVVYRSEVQNATVDSKFQIANFPDTVVLDTAITDYVDVRYRAVDSSKMFDCMGSLDSSRFRMDCYTESGSIRIQYRSSDGITYTRTDTTGNPVDFGTEIYYEMAEMWNDAIGKFIQVGGSTFEGLYQYDSKHISTTDFALLSTNGINVDDKTYVGTPIGNYNKTDIEIIVKKIKRELGIGDINMQVSISTIDGELVITFFLSSTKDICYCNDLCYDKTNKRYQISSSWNYIGDVYVYKLNTENHTYELLQKTSKSSGYFYVDVSGNLDSLFLNASLKTDNTFSTNHTAVTYLRTSENGKNSSSITFSGNDINAELYLLEPKYLTAPTQLSATSDYVYEKEFYGKNGLETGTLTQDVSNSFADANAGLYSKIKNQYDNMEPRILTDDDKTIDKNIYFIPVKKDGTVLLDTSNVTNTANMFKNCTNLTEIPLLNTSSVTYMDSMFNGCANLTTIPLLDTSNVTAMEYVFSGCTNLTEIPLLNTSSATDTQDMFYGCTNLTEIPLLDTSKVTYMGSMFRGCTNLTTIPLLDTSSVADMQNTFSDCTGLSDDSLNNILAMCTNAIKHTSNKTLAYIGLTSEQANKCKTLSNYSAFTAAGWTTGY